MSHAYLWLADAAHESLYVLFGVVLGYGDLAVCVQWERVLHQHSIEQARHIQTHCNTSPWLQKWVQVAAKKFSVSTVLLIIRSTIV